MRLRQIIGIGIASAYLLFLTGIYFYIPFGDPGYEYGGIRLIFYTLPWGLVGQFFGIVGAIAPDHIGDLVAFFVFVVLCGGANAYIIMRLFSYRLGKRGMRVIAGLGLAIAVAAQVTAGPRERAARDYHWPPNVPKSAFLVPHWSGGWYQECQFDPDTKKNYCQIWNFGGLTLYDEEFVPYDAGPPVPPDQLSIVDRSSGPDRVTLASGRILIPKSREADLRKLLDRQ